MRRSVICLALGLSVAACSTEPRIDTVPPPALPAQLLDPVPCSAVLRFSPTASDPSATFATKDIYLVLTIEDAMEAALAQALAGVFSDVQVVDRADAAVSVACCVVDARLRNPSFDLDSLVAGWRNNSALTVHLDVEVRPAKGEAAIIHASGKPPLVEKSVATLGGISFDPLKMSQFMVRDAVADFLVQLDALPAIKQLRNPAPEASRRSR